MFNHVRRMIGAIFTIQISNFARSIGGRKMNDLNIYTLRLTQKEKLIFKVIHTASILRKKSPFFRSQVFFHVKTLLKG